MIAVTAKGGLGNQLFQYATARSLADRLGTDLVIDSSWYRLRGLHTQRELVLDKLRIRASFRAFPVRRFAFRQPPRFAEKSFSYDPAVRDLPDGTHLDGYFQSPRYFDDNRDKLMADLQPVGDLSGEGARLASLIGAAEYPVSLHVRRGDYVTSKSAASVLGTLDVAYYRRAMKHLSELHKTVVVFSDDLEWCRENLRLGEALVFPEAPLTPVEDLTLMSRCRAHVIANSSFSWWGAWLDPTPGKLVVAPEQWSADGSLQTQDLLPSEWLRV